MDSDLSPRSCMNAIIGLLLLLLFCFIIGIAVQVGWQLLTGTPTRDTTLGTPILLPTVIAANTVPVKRATTTPSVTASKTMVASKTPKARATATAKAKASRTPTITLTPTLTEYIVGAGDTLGAIGVEYDISIEDILVMNPELNPDRLSIGDVIIIPTLTPTLTPSPRQSRTPSARKTKTPVISLTRTPPKSRTPRSTATKKIPPTFREHTIQAGDTLLDIAFKYDVSVEALLKANRSLNPGALRIGEIIVIPAE